MSFHVTFDDVIITAQTKQYKYVNEMCDETSSIFKQYHVSLCVFVFIWMYRIRDRLIEKTNAIKELSVFSSTLLGILKSIESHKSIFLTCFFGKRKKRRKDIVQFGVTNNLADFARVFFNVTI